MMRHLDYGQEPRLYYCVNGGDGLSSYCLCLPLGLYWGWPVALNPIGNGPHCSSSLTEGGHACLENLPPTIPAEWVAGILELLMYFCRAHWPGDYLKKKKNCCKMSLISLGQKRAPSQPHQLLLLFTSYSMMLKITEILGFPGGSVIDSILLMQWGVGQIPGQGMKI